MASTASTDLMFLASCWPEENIRTSQHTASAHTTSPLKWSLDPGASWDLGDTSQHSASHRHPDRGVGWYLAAPQEQTSRGRANRHPAAVPPARPTVKQVWSELQQTLGGDHTAEWTLNQQTERKSININKVDIHTKNPSRGHQHFKDQR